MQDLRLKRESELQISLQETGATNIIEDCHVTTDESSYGDWLIQQGLEQPEEISKSKIDDMVTNAENKCETVVIIKDDTVKDKQENEKPYVGETYEVKQDFVAKLDEQRRTSLVVAQVHKSENICKNEEDTLTNRGSDSLNQLIDKLNKYIGPRSVEDCESKINRLRNILNILDSDEQKNEENIAKMPSGDDCGIIEETGVVNPEKKEHEPKIQDDGTEKTKRIGILT